MDKNIELEGVRCRVVSLAGSGPAIIWIAGEDTGGDAFEDMENILGEKEDELGRYVLLMAEIEGWDDSLSPWKAEAGGRSFSGRGRKTQMWITDTVLPYLKKEFPGITEFAITGYSLAGLFSLWTYYETGVFKGAGCCSGSLWFPGWNEYADRARSPENGAVYLSLGGKEAGSGNVLTASVGTQYLRQKKRLLNDRNVRGCQYELNAGGHFSNPVKRMAKSIAWLIKELSVYRGRSEQRGQGPLKSFRNPSS